MNPSDIVTCNGPQLASLRKSGGLTQDELAHEARLSVRVIRKAEKSGNIRFSTLSAIAEALRTHGADAAAERLCCDPVTIAQQFVEAYRRHEEKMTDHIRHLLCPDLDVFVAGDPSQIPFAGTFHGPDGLQEMWCRFFGLIERYDK
ncbi:MAG: helix-turn-helix transcriptional regulator, partial [Planctomycetaceae bacterium]|nr:helix-turn-helix transcriptional regulator [Planctomycetaceae bacterium]